MCDVQYNISTETSSRKEEGKATQKKNKSEIEINGELILVYVNLASVTKTDVFLLLSVV